MKLKSIEFEHEGGKIVMSPEEAFGLWIELGKYFRTDDIKTVPMPYPVYPTYPTYPIIYGTGTTDKINLNEITC